MNLTVEELERLAREANPALAYVLAQLLRDKNVTPNALARVPRSRLNLTTT